MGWGRFVRRSRWDQERALEIQTYLDIEADENIARGMAPDEAYRAARRKLGNPTLIREDIYQMNTIGVVETIGHDLRYGARLLRLNPAFAAVAILSLALGIGANTAIFQLLDAVRLRRLPVKDPWQLVEVRIPPGTLRTGSFSGGRPALTNPLWEQIRDHQRVFSGMFAWSSRPFNLSSGGEARYAQGLWVSGDFFSVLGVPALLGRALTPADDRRGCGSPGAVISYAFWQREFGGRRSAIGSKLLLEGHPFEVVGITPARFFGVEVGRHFDVAVPLCAEPSIRGEFSGFDKRDSWWLAAMGRLKPDVSLAQAAADLGSISPGLFAETLPATYSAGDRKGYLAFRLGAFPGGSGVSSLRTEYEAPLWLLLATSGLVLLIACANLANLMLARASACEREIAVRLALGASRRRVIRQLLAESLLLATVGAVVGGFIAQTLSRLLVSFLTTQGNQLFVDLQPDWRLFAFTAALAVVTCLLFGLTPAVRATQTAPGTVMKATSRGLTATRERFGLRRALVVVQVALSLVLIVGALLFVRSLRNLLTLDTGFRREGILITQLDLRRVNLPPERRAPLYRDLLERLRTLPGVDSAAQTEIVPVSGQGWNQNLLVEGAGDDRKLLVNVNRVSAEYFRTLGTPLLAGRDFDQRDTTTSPKVAIVNESFAGRFFGGPNPVGKTFRFEELAGEKAPRYAIVGIVSDTKYTELREEFTPIAFVAASQDRRPELFDQVLIRSSAPIASLITSVKRVVGEANPAIAIDFQVLSTQIRDTLLRERLMATLSGLFGVLAGLLAAIGLYGVISYMVARRRNEIGIRMALGADRRAVVTMIMREAAVLLAVGLTAGTLIAAVAARTASALLFGVRPGDPSTLMMAFGLLASVAAAASYLPARRAARLEPTAALRED